ncbi:hypothetical protein [Bosea sp. 124]|uniref:hypothetical protein n=1 Tax=Bosea sp. 124 TaxID=2135642 RepID=UPI000D33A617|nr:hypothetical protein [Bosea sp. 124]
MIICASFDQAEADHQSLTDFKRGVAGRPDRFFCFLIDGEGANAGCLEHFAEHRRQIGLSEYGQDMRDLPRIGRRFLPPARTVFAIEESRANVLAQRPFPRFRDETAPLLLRQPY